MTPPRRRLEYTPLDGLVAAPRNPKQHASLADSFGRFGYVEPVVIDERTGRLVAGHGRVDELRRSQSAGDPPPEGIDQSPDGAWLVPVLRGWASANDREADAYLLASNQLTIAGGWDDTLLMDVLSGLGDVGALGFTDADLERLMHDVSGLHDAAAQEQEYKAIRGRQPSLRSVPMDVIFSYRVPSSQSSIAAALGFKLGCISRNFDRARWGTIEARYGQGLAFVDNEWVNYDHARHVEAVAFARPTYATTRDLLTREQARAAKVEWYSVEQTLEWAAELEGHAQRVILIPKYDCVDRLPERYVLGYSVPTSYGATPLVTSMFEGRAVHLLGGSWAAQRTYLAAFGEQVVSLDHNWACNAARFGCYAMPDGSLRKLPRDVPDALFPSLALTLASIRRAVLDMHGGFTEQDGDDRDLTREGVPEDDLDLDDVGA